MKEYLVTSESVTEGHPDKICDQISDGILDAYLEQDPESRVAVETMISPNTIMIAGEVTSKAKVDVPGVAREIVKKIGYTQPCTGFDCQNAMVLTNITSQSPDIARGVDSSLEDGSCGKKVFGAGDQGMMYGYACDETEHYMPITIDLAHRLVMKLAQVRKDGTVPWLYPDGKSQVTMKYSEEGKPLCLTGIVISAQHSAEVDRETVCNTILQKVIQSEVDPKWMNSETKIYINQTGRFVIGGPAADVGLTGRKIMVDTYGGVGKHGGGAFSGKDPTKVDRSAAYMARYAAKNIVAAKLAAKCEVSLAYAIGMADPVAVTVNTFGTEKISRECIDAAVRETFSFSVADILEQLNLKKPQFLRTAAYGHFGREDQDFQWEKLDKVQLLQEKAIQSVAGLICN
ncbi:methionine adenosyltransferase [Caproiciproducens faecalis]|uniref:S-adenosylmethionine synthase n=1 Tax=Caproiciproducens faecalis TaxID=2820301 RepID=A0ABS7DLV8_9FIRM|nr:methionine adenosyltransferase [Caproiciproducens faecalis]MBW7572280.1 methionine adenosyltransferase [Caproiciproducens faecalis]